MVRAQLDERQWARIKAVLVSRRGAGRPPRDDRNFIEAVLWWRRTGVPWRDLPDVFGPWKTVFNRFDRWAKTGKWKGLFEALRRTATTSGTSEVECTFNLLKQARRFATRYENAAVPR